MKKHIYWPFLFSLFFIVLLTSIIIASFILSPSPQTIVPSHNISPQDKKIDRTIKVLEVLDQHHTAIKDTPYFTDPGQRINITMTKRQHNYFKRIDSQHYTNWREDVKVAFAQGDPLNAIAKLHGISSLLTPKKSFYIKLFQRISFTKELKSNRFLLINLIYDTHHFKMAYSYRLLQKIELFPSFFQFVTVYINGEAQGLYLLVERPVDAVRRLYPDVKSVTRRRKKEQLEVKYSIPQFNPVHSLQALNALHKQTLSDDQQAIAVKRYLHTPHYFSWLAFNSLIKNGDSVDEVFFYELYTNNEKRGRNNVIGWDYDDIMTNPSHPKQSLKDPLLYACETKLDAIIQQNPILYRDFKHVFKTLLQEKLTPLVLTQTLNNVQATLDNLDTGEPLSVQKKRQAERDQEMKSFRDHLLKRYNDLMLLL